MSILILLCLIGVSSYYFSIKCIKRLDKTEIIISKNVIATIIITTLGLYNLNSNFEGVFSIIFAQFLIIVAYIDYKTRFVYTLFNIIMGIIILGYYALNSFKISQESLIVLFIFCLFILIMGKQNFFGDGDKELYILIAFFFSIIYRGDMAMLLILNMLISNLFFLLVNIKSVINYFLKKGNKVKKAFVPYMALSSIFLIMIC